MSGFRAWLNNPNVHLVISAILQVAAFLPATAPYAPILQTVGAVLTTTGAILPESGSMHQQDYAKLADTVATAIASTAKTVETSGRT